MSSAEFSGEIEAGILSDALETLQSVAHEATLRFEEDGIHANPVDPANVSMVTQHVKNSAFVHYHATEFRLGVNLERFQDYVDTAESDGEPIEVAYDPETRRVEITTDAAEMEMAGIDPDSVKEGQRVEETDIDWQEDMIVDVEMDGAALSHAIDVVSMASDHIAISADPDADAPLVFSGEGDTDAVRVPFKNALYEGSDVKLAGQSLYSWEYFDELMKPMPDTAGVRFRCGDEYPCRMDYEYADGAVDVAMMLAPRIQSN